jgi:hypothetical protein
MTMYSQKFTCFYRCTIAKNREYAHIHFKQTLCQVNIAIYLYYLCFLITLLTYLLTHTYVSLLHYYLPIYLLTFMFPYLLTLLIYLYF